MQIPDLEMAETYFRERDFEMAQKESREMLSISPDNYQAMMTLGNSYLYQKKYSQARQAYETLIEKAPGNPAGYFRLSNLGAVAPGYYANLVVLDELDDLKINEVFYRCRLVAR